MNCITVIGMTGQGKSTFIKQFIDGKNCFVFDVQNEYLLSTNPNESRSKDISLDEKRFVEMCKRKRNTVIVFEEATGFFEGKLDKEVRRIILSKRHTQNTLVFCFHSISSVPPRLMQFTNYVILFKTLDEPYQVEGKFPTLYPYFVKVRSMQHQQYLNIKTIPQ